MARKPAPTKAHPEPKSTKPATTSEHPALMLYDALNALHTVCSNAGAFRELAERRKQARAMQLSFLNLRGKIASDRANELARAGAPMDQQWAALSEGMDRANDPPPSNEPAEYTKSLRENILDHGRTWCERARAALRAGGAKGLDAATQPNAAGQARSIELHTKLQDAERVFLGLTIGVGDPRIILEKDAASMADLGEWFGRTRDELSAVLEMRGLDTPAPVDAPEESTAKSTAEVQTEIRAWVRDNPSVRAWLKERFRECVGVSIELGHAEGPRYVDPADTNAVRALTPEHRLLMAVKIVVSLHDMGWADPVWDDTSGVTGHTNDPYVLGKRTDDYAAAMDLHIAERLSAESGVACFNIVKRGWESVKTATVGLNSGIGDVKPRAIPSGADANDDAMLPAAELARLLDVEPEALRKRLERWKRVNQDGWIETANPTSREPKYLYRLGAVRPIAAKLRASDEASAKRLPRK